MDIFPTLYRANTKAAVTRLAHSAGLQIEQIERVERRPEYLRFSAPTYMVGVVYERLVNFTDLLALFRVLLVGKLRKPGA